MLTVCRHSPLSLRSLQNPVEAHHEAADERAHSHVQTVRDKCFEKCITAPGRSLTANEQTCLQRCVDRYGEVCCWCEMQMPLFSCVQCAQPTTLLLHGTSAFNDLCPACHAAWLHAGDRASNTDHCSRWVINDTICSVITELDRRRSNASRR